MAVPVNDFFFRVVGSANKLDIKYPATWDSDPSKTRGIFRRKPKGTRVPLTEVVDQLNQDLVQADLGNVTFNYGKGVIGSQGGETYIGGENLKKLQVQGSEVISKTLPIITTQEDYANIGIKSVLDYAHQYPLSDVSDKNLVQTFLTAQNVSEDLTNIGSLNVLSPEAVASSDFLGTTLHEFTHSANAKATFQGGFPIREDQRYYQSALNSLLDSDYKPSEDWMPDFQKNLNLAFAQHGAEEARAELGRLSFLGHPSENISKKIDPDYIPYIGRMSSENPIFHASGSEFRPYYGSALYEPIIKNFTPQVFKDQTTGLVMEESEKWIQAALREGEMNAHAAGVMTILHNSEHIPGFQQQRELMMQMFEAEQKNNPEYGRAVENLRQDMFAPGEEPAFRVDIPGARYLDSPQSAVTSSVAEVIEDSIGSQHTLSTATATAAEVATTRGAVTGTASVASPVMKAVGGGAGAAVTSTTGSLTARATSVATAAAAKGARTVTRSAASASKNVSKELIKGFKNVDKIRMAGVMGILGGRFS